MYVDDDNVRRVLNYTQESASIINTTNSANLPFSEKSDEVRSLDFRPRVVRQENRRRRHRSVCRFASLHSSMEPSHAPILSTPAEHLLEEPVAINSQRPVQRLSDEQLLVQYEINRTVREIREGRWKRIALQFPDDTLCDAPRVYEHLSSRLRDARHSSLDDQVDSFQHLRVSGQSASEETSTDTDGDSNASERLTILGDTSYGACCVDEVAAEHVAAEVVVHYGRSCMSPTARLPVIYVFTSKRLDVDAAITSLTALFPDRSEKLCILADVPYQGHMSQVTKRLDALQYSHISAPDLVHDPTSLIPNRAMPSDIGDHAEYLKDCSVFHIGHPPTALLLVLASRVKTISIFDPTSTDSSAATDTNSKGILRRRYASLLKLSTAGIIGVLVNTLSVRDYLSAVDQVQSMIAEAGKKSYTFVVGKLNPPKLANFAEVGGWVVIGCWESSLVDARDFYAPVVTPFELRVALMRDDSRIWGAEWIADFRALLQEHRQNGRLQESDAPDATPDERQRWEDQSDDDDEPPEFDLRTGRYISHARPTRSKKPAHLPTTGPSTAPPSSALVQRAKNDIATVNGVVSPGAEFLRSKREWQGLGSDYDVAYDRDAEGKIQGASMEVGRSGVAKGYTVGDEDTQS